MPTLKCEMTNDCQHPVTHIDKSGFVYCTAHGLRRRMYEPCRKLRSTELKRLQRGEQLKKY